MAKRSGLSYVQKTVLPYLALLIVSLAGVGLSTTRFFERFVMQNWEKELTSEVSLASEVLSIEPIISQENPDLTEQALHLSEVTGNRITIIQADGTVVGESDHAVAGMENHLLRPEIQAALAGQTQVAIRLSTTMHQRYIYAAAPIFDDQGNIIGVVRSAKTLADYDATIARFRIILLITAGCSLILAILFMLLQSTRRLNPLRKISEAIYQSSEGELKVIEGKERKDEIGLIVAAHNAQVEKINQQIHTLQDERTKLAAILNNMNDGVILVNAEGLVTLINPGAQKMFATTMSPDEEHSLIEVVRQHQIVELWKQTLASGKAQSAMIQTSLEKESLQAIASMLGPVLPGEVLLLFQDLTQLRKLETVRKDFVSNISHELRTPLASLKALSETLQDGALNDPTVSSHFLGQMDDEIDNLTQIVQELLELARIESGKVPFEKRKVKVDEILSPSVERMRLQAERSGISIEAKINPGLPAIEVDLMRIQQVFVNLIHNAIKFTPPGGKILTSAVKENGSIIFSVADTGAGIPATDLERIFERFYKSDRSRSSGGTGLGLSISRHIIEAHGGKIWVESIQGKGSIFYFSIPIHSTKS